MSTNDVPGNDPKNRDELAMGCWAEHEDGSLIFCESTEDDRVIFSVFDLDKAPVVEYRDSMAVGAFKKAFSWNPKKPETEKWTWHDKSPFPWDRVIKLGARDGARHASAEDHISAAERIRESRNTRGRPVDPREFEARMDKLGRKAKKIIEKIQSVISELRP